VFFHLPRSQEAIALHSWALPLHRNTATNVL